MLSRYIATQFNNATSIILTCYLGGRQFFNDPRIGDFSITFTTRDGEGEGLTGPVLQLKYIDNWKEIAVTDSRFINMTHCPAKMQTGPTVKKDPFICKYK